MLLFFLVFMLTFVAPLFLIFIGIILAGMKVVGSQQLRKGSNPSPAVLRQTTVSSPLAKAIIKATVVKEAAKPPSKVISSKETEEEVQPSDREILEWFLREGGEPSHQGAQPTDAELGAWMNIALKTSSSTFNPILNEQKLLAKRLLEKYKRRKRVK